MAGLRWYLRSHCGGLHNFQFGMFHALSWACLRIFSVSSTDYQNQWLPDGRRLLFPVTSILPLFADGVVAVISF